MKKYLLIFGSNGSLGKGVSKVLSKKNYDEIYLFDPTKKEDIPQSGKFVQVGDLSKEENVESAFNKINIDKNGYYFLFCSIGGFAGGNNIKETNFEEWGKMFALNLNIPFLLSKYFSKLAVGSLGGSICFTSALTGLSPSENKASYGASKNSLNYLTKTLAKEGRKYNFSANAIAPLVLDTKENREWIKDKSKLVNSESIGELIFAIFDNFKIISGNIIELPGTLK